MFMMIFGQHLLYRPMVAPLGSCDSINTLVGQQQIETLVFLLQRVNFYAPNHLIARPFVQPTTRALWFHPAPGSTHIRLLPKAK